MAKGNLFLGTAARSVGDVVMYRREGSQVSRVRVRKIANPKTEAQCRQRAYMAPIPKFFSPLAVVLERSFEGLSKSKSYSKFLKVNADKARANDWLLPKGIGFFPLPYQLSQGTLRSVSYGTPDGGNGVTIIGATPVQELTTIGNLSEIFVGLGYQNGDVVTFIMACSKTNPNFSGLYPYAAQFTIDTTSTDAIADVLKGVTFSSNQGMVKFNSSPDYMVAAAIIVARFENDKWRRSTQELRVDATLISQIEANAYKAAAIASYSNTVGDPNPMVYLDGDELDNA